MPCLDRTVSFFAVLVDLTNFLEQNFIALTALGPFTISPVVVPTATDLECLAHPFHSKFFVVSSDKGVLHLSSLAKYAAAFFRMFRSSLTCSSSWRNRA